MASRSARAGAAAAAATRAAAMASRSARAAGVAAAAARAAAARCRGDSGAILPIKSCPSRPGLENGSTKPRDDALSYTSPCADYYAKLSDAGIILMDKDLESDEAVWALYERWCKTYKKKRDHAEMTRRFKLFKHYAQHARNWNTCVPEDPKIAAIYLRKRRHVDLLLSRGEDTSHIHDQYVPLELYRSADGSEPFLSKYDKDLLKQIEEREQAGISTVELFGYGNPRSSIR